jgi:hypothetical protein
MTDLYGFVTVAGSSKRLAAFGRALTNASVVMLVCPNAAPHRSTPIPIALCVGSLPGLCTSSAKDSRREQRDQFIWAVVVCVERRTRFAPRSAAMCHVLAMGRNFSTSSGSPLARAQSDRA